MSKIAEKYNINLTYDHKTACPGCRRKGLDNSGNNLQVYGSNQSAYCFACEWTIPSAEHRAKMGWDEDEEEEEYEEVSTKEKITEEENKHLKSYTGTKSKGWRGIRDETNVIFGVRYSYDEETGEPDAQYVPCTQDGKLTGYKVRHFPKDFGSPVGVTGKDCDMIGQFKFTGGGKVVVIVGGEVDFLSAYQMLRDYQLTRPGGEDFQPVAVVAPSTGENCYKQVQAQYEFFNKFDKIIIGLDNDEAGRKATEKVAKVLPKGKVFVAEWSKKDPNAMLTAGQERAFINDYYRAKPYTPDGIVGSGSLGSKVREAALVPKIPLPPFMHKVQKQMAGGIPLGVIVNIGSASGTGKSTIVDECTYYWVFNSPHKIGVLSLESDSGQYGTKVLSRHVGRKIDLIETIEEKMEFLNSPEVLAKEQELWYNADGSDRWYLIDERDGGLDSVKEKIEQLIIECECKVIIIDPLQDLMDGLPNDEQAIFQRWMKGMIKSHKVTFININHTRKTPQGGKQGSQGAELTEEDFLGTSSIYKSAAANLLFSRNKEAEDEIERNTTYMKMAKCRWTGVTGLSGAYYYDNATHTMFDKDDYTSSANGGAGSEF